MHSYARRMLKLNFDPIRTLCISTKAHGTHRSLWGQHAISRLYHPPHHSNPNPVSKTGFAARLRYDLIECRKEQGFGMGGVTIVGGVDRSTMGVHSGGARVGFRGALRLAQRAAAWEIGTAGPWLPQAAFLENGPGALAAFDGGKVEGRLAVYGEC